jgi:glycosyltransferase involved in cell wall biosynthesis
VSLPKTTFLEHQNGPTVLERLVKNCSKNWATIMRRKRQRESLFSALREQRPDILHLHNLHASALQHEDLTLISPSVRLVWTMHDCWPWAPWAYRWKDELGSDKVQGAELRLESDALAARSKFFDRREDTVLVSPSGWLAQEARRHVNDGVRVTVIPNGVPHDVFEPVAKEQAQALIGLDPSKTWIGLSAASFDHRKGSDILMEALGTLSRADLGLVVWGNCKEIKVAAPVEIFSAGYVRNEKHQAMLYSACDLFVCPSRSDNLPNTVLESMSCGTPVVASHIGGIPDMVRPGDTGWLYSPNSAQACAAALSEALQSSEKWHLYGERCRRIAVDEYSLDLQASRYVDLYQEVISRQNAKGTTAA